MPNNSSIGSWALHAIEFRLCVFPLRPRDKKPVYKKSYRDATLSRIKVVRHWRRCPTHNCGIATGYGLFVLDIDGPSGEASLQALCDKCGPLPRTVTVITPKGRHLYFKSGKALVGNSVGKLGPGLDVRGDGGYVVGAGSIHPSGQVYRYAPGLDPKSIPIAMAPPSLLELVKKPPILTPAAPAKPVPRSERNRAYGEAALDAENRRLASAPDHQRNNTVNRCAFRLGQLIGAGYLGESEVVGRLTQTALEIGLTADEIDRTIRSGIEAGKRSPRKRSGSAAQSASQKRPGNDNDPLTSELAQLGCTDTDNADRFVKRYGHSFAFSPEFGWLAWTGKRWEHDAAQRRVLAATETARLIKVEIANLTDSSEQKKRAAHAKQSLSKAALDRMLALAAPKMIVGAAKLDADPWLFNVLNGTIDLRVGRLLRHNPRDMITKLAPAKYDQEAKAPTFFRFLRRVLKGDGQLCRYLKKSVGYSLTGSTGEQVFFYVRGGGKTGKSTFVNSIRDMLGDYAEHTPTETLLVKAYDNNIPNDLARLKGARMVTAIEAPAGKQLNEARIKAITGGDPIPARFMRAEWFTFVPQFKLWFVANDDPRVRSTDAALWRRIRVIPFDVVIPDDEVDPDLSEKLRAEWPGILAWAVHGCLQWQRDGLKTPDVVLAATSSYRKRADHVLRFLRECVFQEEHADTASGLVHQAYTDWCATNHERPLSTAQFKRQLEDGGFEHARVKSGSVWRHIRLRR